MAEQSKSTTDKLEDAFLAVAEESPGAMARLGEVLDALGEVPDKSAVAAINENLPVLVDDHERVATDKALQQVILRIAGMGGRGMPLRDALAVICRRVHSSYPDPAGLIRALGILDADVQIPEVCRRWERFDCLCEGNYVWHDSYGLGRIAEVDGFSDMYAIQFAGRQTFSLHACLTSLGFVRKGSIAEKLLAEPPTEQPPRDATSQFVDSIRNSFTPALKDPWIALDAILVPRHISSREYAAWRQKTKSASGTVEAGAERTWEQSRSLDELLVLLQDAENLEPSREGIDNLSKIYRFSATRSNFRHVLAETLAMLGEKSVDDTWLNEILMALPDETVSWEPLETFSKITSKLKAKQRDSWLRLVARARGNDWFVDATLALPHRFWSICEEILGVDSEPYARLVERVKEQVRRGEARADAALWLWEIPGGRGRDAFANPNSVFRILSQPVSGDHIKARKRLFELLMDDNSFQASLMRGGSDEGIQAFVRAIKTSSVLQKGEQQSLLVKIVRIFPEAKGIVEERQEIIAKRPLPKITSFRNMKQRYEELQEIINKKIPENSAAIAHARSYGDLRENAEFKAAKDEQRFLAARRGELERDLKEITPTDFSDVVIGDAVIPGCTVELEVDGASEIYHILGIWDSIPEKHFISYDTPLGRKLIGRSIGSTIEITDDVSGIITDIRALPEEILAWVKLPD